MKKNKKYSWLKIFLFIAFLILFIFWGLRSGQEWAIQENCKNIIEALVYGLISIFKNPLDLSIVISLNTLYSILGALSIYAIILVFLRLDEQRNKHYEGDDACGSAKWNDDIDEYNKRYSDPHGSTANDGERNMILSQNVRLNMNCYETMRNNNILIIGGAGTGKSRGIIKPNLLQANCNYVITDPKGDILKATGNFLVSEGYEVKVFNLVEMNKSDKYNPFEYVRDENGVLMMIKCLMINTTPSKKQSGDPFWERAEENLFLALAFYLYYHCDKKHRHFSRIMDLLRLAEVDERDSSKKSALDTLFDDVEKKDPNSIAVKRYKSFKSGAGKTLKSIIISCSSRLTVFDFEQVKNLTSEDNLHLDEMGDGKKALFVIIPSADSTFNFLVSMMYNQMFETLYNVAETKNRTPSLNRDVRFLLDEFSNVGEIPEFDKKISTMRQYRISCTIVLQDLAQLKARYKDTSDTIIGNCDTTIFLGSNTLETAKYISDSLGDSTIIVRDRGRSLGKSKSSSQNYKTTKRKLMPPEEVLHMDEKKCIVMVRGIDPFLDDKYNYVKHPNYCKTGDADESNNYINARDNRSKKSCAVINEKIKEQRAEEMASFTGKTPLPPAPSPPSNDETSVPEKAQPEADTDVGTNYEAYIDEYIKSKLFEDALAAPESSPIGEIKDFAETMAEKGLVSAEEIKEIIEEMPIGATIAAEASPPPSSSSACLNAMMKVIDDSPAMTGRPSISPNEPQECWDFDYTV